MNYYRRISKHDQIENIDTVVEMLYIEGELVVDITKLVYFEDSFLYVN